ncbi:Ypt/Rab-GAP domain of gyp1p superfamily protein [Striga asiatica]|uniref:Ypt/Rab-GAP domain of gyp1p superfamily protein n=1 Tax=Striga asiatica TaxID=4170 RepID=A0A5A7PLD0_STRAF|nr:Ypt/Rab-GAP domain of gyp1p superfamily protein [Striga asiatica]
MKALKRSQTSSSSKSSPPSSSSNTPSSSSPPSSSWIHLRSVLFIVASSNNSPDISPSSSRGRLKSPWFRRKRKHILSPDQWRNYFTPEGKLRDNGVKFLKKVRSGVSLYDLTSCKEERDVTRTKNRKEYEKLRRQCSRLLKRNSSSKHSESNESGETISPGTDSPASEDVESARQSLSSEESSFQNNNIIDENDPPSSSITDSHVCSRRIISDANSASNSESDSTDSDSSDEHETSQTFSLTENADHHEDESSETNSRPPLCSQEDFATWQRIIRLDAIRANDEWISYKPPQAIISDSKARRAAEAVGLRDYEHLSPARIFHAARLVAILEAYALYDSEIGYCQGMSDLLSPIISVVTEDHEAFWCFVGFMKKARHNFRLDEVGIRRQLSTVSKIIKYKDSHLYRHLEKLEAEDCFFVYRMVVVLFRRELTFEQTLCLWEVMWADQAAIRAGIGKSAWSRIRQRAPPTDDLLLYAIAASVLQRRKQIIESYSSMDEILRECNAMAGHLDVWKLLDDAHDLVVTLHEKIGT